MYWLLPPDAQADVRATVDRLVNDLSLITGFRQDDQLFPYVGRKDRRKARVVVEDLTEPGEIVCDPFLGSGILGYAAAESGRHVRLNEWEPYAHRMSSSPWRLADASDLHTARAELLREVAPQLRELYWTRCLCGQDHVLHSLFFDRQPLRYQEITDHERLGADGANLTYRGRFRCPACGATEKHVDREDLAHLEDLAARPAGRRFDRQLIQNSRINLSPDFTVYGNLFPHRSKLALEVLWDGIARVSCAPPTRGVLEDAFLAILPQAKFKDYRSKSQDLHCPDRTLRETNLLYQFEEQLDKRVKGLAAYSFATQGAPDDVPVACADFRQFLAGLADGEVDLVLTDPPWNDGNAYFEKAQLYHPWLDYSLQDDSARLEDEFVVTDAPARREVHDRDRWWHDLDDFFTQAHRVLKPNRYLALYFRPIPAKQWLSNLNGIRFAARRAGFEPLAAIDVNSADPSMRIQQSAAYVFSEDIVMLFLRLDDSVRRTFGRAADGTGVDVDLYAYRAAEMLQEDRGPFTYAQWQRELAPLLVEQGAADLNGPRHDDLRLALFERYCDQVDPGRFLPKASTPFSGQLFGLPSAERLFTYVPFIVDELTAGGASFTYERFVLKLSEYVENGTRDLIRQVEREDIVRQIENYAQPTEVARTFVRRVRPTLPPGIRSVQLLDPYDFEAFVSELLSRQGFTSVSLMGRAGDRGVDVRAIDPQGQLTVVQCKRYTTSNIAAEPIQRLHSFAITRGALRKIVVTTTDFTPDARDEGRLTNTELVNGALLEEWIAQYLPDYFET